MHLTDSTYLKNISMTQEGTAVTHDQEVVARCVAAKRLEEAGDYDAARLLLGSVWERVGERPRLDGLTEIAAAELLLRAGSLSARIGSAHQIEGAMEIAKDLISHSSRIFEKLGMPERVAEAQIDLAVCYWREGGMDEARITLKQILGTLQGSDSEQQLRALVSLSIFETAATHYEAALRIHIEAAPLFERSQNHGLKGVFHNHYALVLKNLGNAEGRQDYIDRAFIEYAAAGYHFEQAGHTRYVAVVENNLGFLFLTAGKFIEAHQHLNRARSLVVKLKDKGSIAQIDETRARVFLAQGLIAQAEAAVRGSVRTLEEGDDRAILAEALTTHGTALARLDRLERAHTQLKKAIDVASQAGNLEKAGLAALTIIEVLPSYVSQADLREYYSNAESYLAQSQIPGIENRLGGCARAILSVRGANEDSFKTLMTPEPAAVLLFGEGKVSAQPEGQEQPAASEQEWAGCSLENEVLSYEGELIQRALEASRGSVTRAARMLGITHQGLAFILNGRHKSLLTVRTPVRRRRKSIFRNH
jgi:tetratricopeptide (TPR) repeat protein